MVQSLSSVGATPMPRRRRRRHTAGCWLRLFLGLTLAAGCARSAIAPPVAASATTDGNGWQIDQPMAPGEQASAVATPNASEGLQPAAPTLRPRPTLTITAVGDVQLGRAWPEASADLPPDGPATLFRNVRATLAEGDLTFGNLETALADHGDSSKCGKRAKSCYAFRAPSSYARVLADAGFAVVSNANNHAGDFGPEGRAATRAALD